MTSNHAQSAKALFRATKPKGETTEGMFEGIEDQTKPFERDPLDFDPTPRDATQAILSVEKDHMLKHGLIVSEPAVGAGHIAYVLLEAGFQVRAGDVEDRGYKHPFCLGNFLDTKVAPAKISFTNPPYNMINARDGRGVWLRHSLDIGHSYICLLLNTDWAAASINGLRELMINHPPSVEYLCCWKIDFRGGGNPPQRNSFFVWDTNRPALGPETWVRKRLYRNAPPVEQSVMEL